MHFQEITEGEYRIYVGALESPVGDGYTAALVVRHPAVSRDTFCDDRLSCGHRWASADDAMSFALRKGRELVRSMRAVPA